MARADNAYSRLVSWLKILLPLAALAILSTLFLVAETLDPEAAIPYADRDALGDLVAEQGISAPAFSAVSQDGTAVNISASDARPDPSQADLLLSQNLEAEITIKDGARIDISAPTGQLNTADRIATLNGGATLQSSTGFVAKSDSITAHFDGAFAETQTPVEALGPIGTLNAGKMRLDQDAEGRYLLRFTEGVRLLYTPKPTESP